MLGALVGAAVELAGLLDKAGYHVEPIVGGALALLIAAAARPPCTAEPAAGRGGHCGGHVGRFALRREPAEGLRRLAAPSWRAWSR